jgi:uncharacterized GH25 family protein
MTKNNIVLAALCAALFTAGMQSAALAHNPFLLPAQTVMSKGQWVTFDAAISGEMFYFNHQPLKLDNLAITAPDGSAAQAENMITGKVRTVFDVNMTQNGTYRVSNTGGGIGARYKDKTGAQKNWRGAAANFEKEVPADATDLRLTESATRQETFVTVGKPTPIKTTGVGLEFAPVTHPNDLVAGEQAVFGFQLDGKPLADATVEIIPNGSRYRDKLNDFTVKTDAKGEAKILFKDPGLYLLEVNAKDGKTSLKQIKERRLVYTAVLEVQAP